MNRVRAWVSTPIGGTCIQIALVASSLILGLAQSRYYSFPLWVLLSLSIVGLYALMKLPTVQEVSTKKVQRLTDYINDTWSNGYDPNINEVVFRLLDEYETSRQHGIHNRGWWCLHPTASGVACDTFNGEEHSKHSKCRRCEQPKFGNPRISAGEQQ